MQKKSWGYALLWVALVRMLTGCSSDIDYTPGLFKPNAGNCWPCKLYMGAFQAINGLMSNALAVMAKNCISLLEIGLEFWLVLKIGPWFWSMNPPNVKKDIKEIAIVFVKSFFVLELLYWPDLIYKYIGELLLQPVGAMFMNMSELILNSPVAIGVDVSNYPGTSSAATGGGSWWDLIKQMASLIGSEHVSSAINMIDEGMNEVESIYSSAADQYQNWYGSTFNHMGKNTSLSVQVINSSDPMFGKLPLQIQNIIWQLYDALWSGMGLGIQLLKEKSFPGIIAGGILIFALISMMIKVPLSFVDAFLRLGVIVILLPLFLLAWIFPYFTKGIFQKVMHMLFAAFFDILFNCIYVAFLITLLRVYTKEKIPYVFSSDYQTQEATLRNAGVALTTGYLLLIVLILTVLHMSSHVISFTNFFFDGSQATSTTQLINRLWKMGRSVLNIGLSLGRSKDAWKELAEQSQGLVTDTLNEARDAGESRSQAQAKNKYEYAEGKTE